MVVPPSFQDNSTSTGSGGQDGAFQGKTIFGSARSCVSIWSERMTSMKHWNIWDWWNRKDLWFLLQKSFSLTVKQVALIFTALLPTWMNKECMTMVILMSRWLWWFRDSVLPYSTLLPSVAFFAADWRPLWRMGGVWSPDIPQDQGKALRESQTN